MKKTFKELLETNQDSVQNKLCEVLNTCILKEEFKYDVCRTSVQIEYKCNKDFISILDEVMTNSIRVLGNDQNLIGVQEAINCRDILNLSDEEFTKVYVDVLYKSYLNYKSYIELKYTDNDDIYNPMAMRMNSLMRVLSDIIRERNGFKNCLVFEIILKCDLFIKVLHNKVYLPIKSKGENK